MMKADRHRLVSKLPNYPQLDCIKISDEFKEYAVHYQCIIETRKEETAILDSAQIEPDANAPHIEDEIEQQPHGQRLIRPHRHLG